MALLTDAIQSSIAKSGMTTGTVYVLEVPKITASNYRSDVPPTPRRKKVIERPAPPGKSARRLLIEERWARKAKS